MRSVIGLALMLAVLANPAFAQLSEVTIDNSVVPGDEIDQVYIDKSTGALIITTITDWEVSRVESGGEVGITSFTVNNGLTLSLPLNGSATLRWSTVNASACSASSTPSNAVTGWKTTTTIGVSSNGNSVSFPTAGMFILTLTCNGPVGSPATKSVQVTVGGVAINTFTATPTTVISGENAQITLEWQTENAIMCSGSSNWPASDDLALPSGSQVISLTNVMTDQVFTLTCAGAANGDEVSKNAVVQVNNVAANCDNVTLATGITNAWGEIFRDNWPGPTSQTVDLAIPETGYLAVEFQTANAVGHGTLGTIERPGTTGGRLGSVSQCAGDFDVAAECQFFWGFSGGIIWATDNQTGACQLEHNTTYYWNTTFTDGVNANTSACAGTYCETSLRVSNRDYIAE